MLEGTIGALTNATVGGGGTNFDFPDLGSDPDATERLVRLFQNDNIIQSNFCFQSNLWNEIFESHNQFVFDINFRQNEDPINYFL